VVRLKMDQDVGNGRLHGGCSAVYLVAFDIRAQRVHGVQLGIVIFSIIAAGSHPFVLMKARAAR
jgi:hypothetical protein